MSARELFGADDMMRGVRYFEDGTTARDVDTLSFGIATTGVIEAARAKAKETDLTKILVRLAEIFNNIGTIISKHSKLRKRDGKNRPPFFYWGAARENFDGRTPWWVTGDRRESYLDMVFLEEYGTIENIVALLKSQKVSGRILLRFVRKTPLREEIASRLERAYAIFTQSDREMQGARELIVLDGDPVHDLATAVQHPEQWCRPAISLMLREAALAGLEGPLAALYPSVMDDRLLHLLWEQCFVPDGLHKALYRSGMTAQELLARGMGDNADALRVDTGELNGVLKAAAALTARAG